MESIVAALEEQQGELDHVLAGLDDDGWATPSRCVGWTVADVVLHLAQSNEMAIASVEGRFAEFVKELTDGLPAATNVDEAVESMVARERGGSAAEVHERYRRSADVFCDLLRDADPKQRVSWVAGELSVPTLATTRLAETWIHTGDVFAAFGRLPVPGERLWHIARLAWRTLPYAFGRAGRQMAGPVAFRLVGPEGQAWDFGDDAPTTVEGPAVDLCLVASRRVPARDTGLRASGPDGDTVLELVRTWA